MTNKQRHQLSSFINFTFIPCGYLIVLSRRSAWYAYHLGQRHMHKGSNDTIPTKVTLNFDILSKNGEDNQQFYKVATKHHKDLK